jgi:hypothetical protein
MLKLALIFVMCLSAIFGQTAAYPGAIATDSNVIVAKNLASTTLTATINSSTLTVPVASTTNFVADSLLAVEGEVMKVCSVSGGTTITICSGGRGFDNTTAVAHTSGIAVRGHIVAYHHNTLGVEIKAIETALGINLANVVVVDAAGTLTNNALTTGAGTQKVKTPSATATIDASGNITIPGTVTTGNGGTVSGSDTFYGLTSGNAAIGVAAIAGTPNKLLLPTVTGTANYVLQTDGANPQQLSWVAAGSANTIKDDIFLPLAGYNIALGTAYPSGLWDFIDGTTDATISVVGGGTAVSLGSYHFLNTNSPAILHRRVLPSTWTSAGGVDFSIVWADECCGSGNVKWIVDTGCAAMGSGNYAYDSGTVGNISFNASSNVTTASGAGGTMPKQSTLTGLAITNCAAGSQFFLRVARDNTVGSNLAGLVRTLYAILTIRRTNI